MDQDPRVAVTRPAQKVEQGWLALNPDDKPLAVNAQDRICHIYDIFNGDEVLQLRDHVGSVISGMECRRPNAGNRRV